MTLLVAFSFPAGHRELCARGTSGAVWRIATPLPWWQGQAGLASSCQCGTVQDAGGFPGQCGACPPMCSLPTRVASHLDPERRHTGWLKAIQSGFVFPQRGVSERIA